MPHWANPILAGLLAAALSFIELVAGRHRTPTWKAAHWIAIGLLFDVAAGSLAWELLILAFGDVKWFTGPWPILIAGLAGPALLRSQLALFGSGQESAKLGPAVVFGALQKTIDRRIASIGGSEESYWVSVVVVPKLKLLPLADIETMVIDYLGYPGHLEGDPSIHIEYVKRVMADEASSPDVRCHSVVERLLQIGGRRLVKKMIKRAKVVSNSNPQLAPVNPQPQPAQTQAVEHQQTPGDEKPAAPSSNG